MSKIKLLSVAVAAAAGLLLASAPARADYDSAGCWGCGTRPVPDGYYCANGCLEEHVGGFSMSGWYGYRAGHSNAYCCSCGAIHSTCLYGAATATSDVKLALESGSGLERVVSTHQQYVTVDRTRGLLIVTGCEGKVVNTFPLTADQLSSLAA